MRDWIKSEYNIGEVVCMRLRGREIGIEQSSI